MTHMLLIGTVRTEPIEGRTDGGEVTCSFRMTTTGPADEPITTTVSTQGGRARWLLDDGRLHPGAPLVVYGALDRHPLTGSFTLAAHAVAFDEYLMERAHD